MGYLGLSEPIEKQDNLFQRLFWPSDHGGEVDALAQQGFWICFFVALSSTIALSFQGHWIIALVTLAFFGLGGMGVREHSMAAAVLVAVAYLLNQLANLFIGIPPGLLSIAAAVLLIANIRGTWIASRWSQRGDPEAIPERMSETWKDRLVDQMPSRVWPRMRVAFFCVSGVYLLLVVLGTGMVVHNMLKPHAVRQQGDQPLTLEVAPQN